jgi:predicted membrane chloride channel (bestrophin family)
MRTLRSLAKIFTWQTLGVALSAVLATYVCRELDFTADFPLTLIGIAIVFPLVFSIGGAYKRRESALDDYGSIKAHGRAIFFAVRDWISDSDAELQERAKQLLGDVLRACRELFETPVDQMSPKEEGVYAAFAKLSKFIQELRGRGLATGEVSRCNQYLSKMLVAFESVKHIYQYRTPQTLRAYSRFFIYLLPILYGPYFAELSKESAAGLAYFTPIFFSVVLVTLENIQEHLENPFDQIGEDDVTINAEKFVARLDL